MVLGACSQYYYMPNMHQVPLLRQKGEFRVAYAGSSEALDPYAEVNGAELQASAAVSDKIGVMLNGADYTSPWSEGHGRFLEAGAGRYLALGPHWTAEGYAGIGRGEVTYSGERTALWRFFAQPSIGYASRNFDFAITTRLCYLDHDRTQTTTGLPNLSDEAYTALQEEIAHGRMLLEPGFVLRAGTRAVKLQLQYAHSANLGRRLSMLEDNISIGIHLNLNNSFRKRQRVPKNRS
jgi:hypothetical protein